MSETHPRIADAYRVVDRFNQGWHPSGTLDQQVWAADYGFQRNLDDVTSLEELESDRGPLRPVELASDEDEAEIRRLLAAAKRKAVTSLCAALELVCNEVREEAKARGMSMPESYDYAMRTMMCGREGSWESEILRSLIVFGNGLNLVRVKNGTAEQMRAAGPAKRVSAEARDGLAAIFRRWVTSPGRYTEVAETLASIVSRYADETAGPGGWRAVADQWLQPGALSAADGRDCYNLLYSRSEHHDPSAWG